MEHGFITPTQSAEPATSARTGGMSGVIPDSHFALPSGVFSGGLPTFDPDFGLDSCDGDVTLEEEFLIEESNTLLSKYGIEPIQESDYLVNPNYIASEVGDDEETASDSKLFIALQLVFHQLYGMKVSWEDTSINSRFGNFAEDLIVLPDGYGQTYLNARKTGNYRNMSFIDIPKLRLAVDIRPMRINHSGTNDGKAQMVGSRQRWIPLEVGFRAQYEMFNLFQDVNLGLIRDKKFPYLPSALGGYGKEPPFRNYGNFERFLQAFKQASHAPLIRDIVRRSLSYLAEKSAGRYPAKDPLLSHVVRFQSSFHDWIKGRTIYAPVAWLDVPPEVGKFRVAKAGDSPVMDEVIARLMAERRLISEQQLEIAVEHNELCKALLKTESITEFKRLRDEARSRFNNFSIFSQENYGMIRELTIHQEEMNSPLSTEIVSQFFRRVDSTRQPLRWILGDEFVYWPEAMDEIYRRGPMKVSFSFQPRNKVGTGSFAAQSSEFKTDIEDTEDLHCLDSLVNWLKSPSPRASPPRQIINDDEPIIASCRKSQYNIIVTDDKRLCKEANRRTRNPVFRIPTLWYHKVIYFGTKHWTEFLEELTPGISWVEHIDTGSIKSFEENNFMDGVMLSQPSIQKFNFWKKVHQKDERITIEFEDYSDEPPERPVELLYDVANILRTRRNQRGRPPPAAHRRD